MKRFSFWFLILILASQLHAGVPEPKGLWEFNASDPLAATVGAPLEIVGTAQEIAGIGAEDGAISIGEGSYYICRHGIAPNGGGAKVNEWTLLIDFWYPSKSLSDPPNGYNDLFQTDPTNTDDADWTINSSGAIGIGAVGYSGAFDFTTQANTWYRMVVVIDNGVRHDLYIDGEEIFKGNQQGIDGRFSLEDALLLFAAGYNQDGDDATINVTTVAIWDVPLSPNEVLTLGYAGESVFTEILAPIVDAGADQTVELDETSRIEVSLEGSVIDDDENLTIGWEVISGHDNIVIEPADSNSATAIITTPGQYVLQLSADDGIFTVTDQVLINAWTNDYNGLIVHWDFEETWNGQDVNDASGNLNYGRIVDGLQGTSEYTPIETGQGLNLSSDELTELGDWLELDLIMPDNGTIAMWVKPVDFYNYHSIFDNSGNGDDWEMWIYGDSRARFRVEGDTAVTASLNNLADDGDGQDKWWHFTCTWARDPNQPDQVATQLFVNGELRDENAGTWVDPGTTFFLGGGHPNNDFCNSTFDDVMIYDKVLPAEEILALVYPDNKPPIVEAGDEQTVWLTAAGTVSVTLAGSVEDIDGSPVGEVTQLWRKVSGPDGVTFETPTEEQTIVTLTVPGLYVFSLTADDGQLTDTDEVVIDVWPFEDTGLIVHLPLDGNVDDVAGGFPTRLVDGTDGNHEFVEGVHGQALKLSGTHDQTNNDFVSISFIYYERGSICLWFNPAELYNYNSILDNSTHANDWEMWVYGSGEFAGRIETGYVRGFWMETQTWYHIAMTWRPKPDNPDIIEQLLYINGEQVASNESEWVQPGDTVFLGGGHDGNDDCNGIIDDFRIYDRPITLTEIQQLASREQ
jgi:hypothetical protein